MRPAGADDQAASVLNQFAGSKGWRQYSSPGALIVNADDWGRDRENTDRTLECIEAATVSSVSAMVFMEDSERAAVLALERGIDAGLHLNLTSEFTLNNCSPRLVDAQSRVARHLLRSRLSQIVYHPGLAKDFEYSVKSQLEEYHRLFGFAPKRVDGHHHMHLSANVLMSRFLPSGIVVRRNFSFEQGEKSVFNRVYRQQIDRFLARKYRIADYLFSLPPIEPISRLYRVFQLAEQKTVELETHPVKSPEHHFLATREIVRHLGQARIVAGYQLATV